MVIHNVNPRWSVFFFVVIVTLIYLCMQQPEPAKSNGAASGAICVNSLGFLPGQQKKALYQFNEIAINWNAALIYALAGFVSNN